MEEEIWTRIKATMVDNDDKDFKIWLVYKTADQIVVF